MTNTVIRGDHRVIGHLTVVNASSLGRCAPDRVSAAQNPLGRLIKLVPTSTFLCIVLCYQVPWYTCRISGYRVHGYLLCAIRLRRDERPRFLIPRNNLSSPQWLFIRLRSPTPFVITTVRLTDTMKIIKNKRIFRKTHFSSKNSKKKIP